MGGTETTTSFDTSSAWLFSFARATVKAASADISKLAVVSALPTKGILALTVVEMPKVALKPTVASVANETADSLMDVYETENSCVQTTRFEV